MTRSRCISEDESPITPAALRQSRQVSSQCSTPCGVALALTLAAAGLLAVAAGIAPAVAQQEAPPSSNSDSYAKLSKAQLERLVAPIELYPDSLVSAVTNWKRSKFATR